MIKVTGLVVENLLNPLGIGTHYPRFSWRSETDIANFVQEAYRIEVRSGEKVIWDSGIVESPESLNIECPQRLAGQTSYLWQVSIRHCGSWYTSYESWFTTGMLNKVWQGEWISGIHNGEMCQPINYIRKGFKLSQTVKSAYLYSTALGVYDCFINGKLVDDECFAPGWTDYFFRVQHQTYDVTKLLNSGKNAIGVRLGEGWYCGSISRRRNSNKPSYGNIPVFRGELHITYEDGSTQIIGTDSSWKCSIGGPVRFSDIYDGEKYDANFDLGDWLNPEYLDAGWSQCLLKNRRIQIVGRVAPPVRRTQSVAPVKIYDIDPKLWKREPCVPDPKRLTIVDFGQNLVGRIRIKIHLPAGNSITIRHGEILDSNGGLFLDNLRSARATVQLIGNGKPFEYEPLFSFFGFRYLQITNLPENFDTSSLSAQVIHSDLERTGTFHCSNELLNKFYQNQLWSNRGNYLDIPTDCPQRDERLGWLADAAIFADTASYNFNIAGFFEKYLADVNSSVTSYGEYPQYAPFFAINHLDADFFGTDYYRGHSGWAEAAIICPWLLYQKYNVLRPLQQHYEKMKAWIYFQEANSDNLIRNACVWRDWLNHNDPTSEKLISTAFFAYGTSLMIKIANLLGFTHDVEDFSRLLQEIKQAFIKEFLNADGTLKESSQTAALLTLRFKLAPVTAEDKILNMLVANLEQRDYHLSTGFLGTPFLLSVLAEYGHIDIAEKLLLQTTFPSWLYPILQGATTIWERWDGYTLENGILPQPMNSFNHYAYGAAASFLYRYIGGIRNDENTPGFRHFILSPTPVGDLSEAETTFISPYGKIISKWKRKGGKLYVNVVIPPNTSASLKLPRVKKQELGSGKYQFVTVDIR